MVERESWGELETSSLQRAKEPRGNIYYLTFHPYLSLDTLVLATPVCCILQFRAWNTLEEKVKYIHDRC